MSAMVSRPVSDGDQEVAMVPYRAVDRHRVSWWNIARIRRNARGGSGQTPVSGRISSPDSMTTMAP